MGTVQFGGAPCSGQRGARLSQHQAGVSDCRQDIDLPGDMIASRASFSARSK
jgi:hypothetical protein